MNEIRLYAPGIGEHFSCFPKEDKSKNEGKEEENQNFRFSEKSLFETKLLFLCVA